MDVHRSVKDITAIGFVQLSEPLLCAECEEIVRYVGEHKVNGNWYCPACGNWIPFSSPDSAVIVLWKRAQRVQDFSILFPANDLIDN